MKKTVHRLLLPAIAACGMQYAMAQQVTTSINAAPGEVPGHFDAKFCAPNWPPGAIKRNERGVTKLHLQVDKNGKLQFATVTQSSGYDDLDRAAVDAMSHCKFFPRLVDGQPADTEFAPTYNWVSAP